MRRATVATHRVTIRADGRRSAAKGPRCLARKGAAAPAGTVYSCLMSSAIGHRGQIVQPRARGMAVAFGWRRLLFALGLSLLFGAANSVPSSAPPVHVT